jgi:heme-degrading monooxygenase HmoA
MSAETTRSIESFYDAWNRHDVPGIVEHFEANGVFADPLTRVEVHGDELADHVRSVLDVIHDLRVIVTRTISADEAAAVVWTIEGTWDGTLGPITATETQVRFEGTDVLELEHGRLRRLRRSFDTHAVADALRLQTIVEPYSDGAMTFGHSLRSWISKEKPGALGMTWILARDEDEKLAIRARARDIISHFREVPGFIGIVTGFAGLHGFTLTAWENEAALRAGTHSGPHRDVIRAFHEEGLSGGVFTSVWEPIRLNRLWTRCPSGHPNDATRANGKCEVCGQPLPAAEPYV